MGGDRQPALRQGQRRARQLGVGQRLGRDAEGREAAAEIRLLLADQPAEDPDQQDAIRRRRGLDQGVPEDDDGGAHEGVLVAQIAQEGVRRQPVAGHVAGEAMPDHGASQSGPLAWRSQWRRSRPAGRMARAVAKSVGRDRGGIRQKGRAFGCIEAGREAVSSPGEQAFKAAEPGRPWRGTMKTHGITNRRRRCGDPPFAVARAGRGYRRTTRASPLDLELVAAFEANLGAVERRAATLGTRRTVKKDWQAAWLLRAITLMDLTTLNGDDTPGRVERLCAKARHPLRAGHRSTALGIARPRTSRPARSASITPSSRPRSKALEGTGIPVAAVSTGFPARPRAARHASSREIEASVAAGAERDRHRHRRAHMVLTGDWQALYDEIKAFREACGDAHIKTILGTGDLATLQQRRARPRWSA